jgi:hypothetical protein
MTDLQAFTDEIMLFLTGEDVRELEEKAGVRFPLEENWTDLCYVCCWMGMKGELPGSVHNRMVLGESNPWTELYLKIRANRSEARMRLNSADLFELAG